MKCIRQAVQHHILLLYILDWVQAGVLKNDRCFLVLSVLEAQRTAL